MDKISPWKTTSISARRTLEVTLMDYFKENILVMGLAAGEEVKECPIVHAIQTTTLVSLETAASKRMRVSKT